MSTHLENECEEAVDITDDELDYSGGITHMSKARNERDIIVDTAELHQRSEQDDQATWFTTDQGIPVSDNQNSLKSGARSNALGGFCPAGKDLPLEHKVPSIILSLRRATRLYRPGRSRPSLSDENLGP